MASGLATIKNLSKRTAPGGDNNRSKKMVFKNFSTRSMKALLSNRRGELKFLFDKLQDNSDNVNSLDFCCRKVLHRAAAGSFYYSYKLPG